MGLTGTKLEKALSASVPDSERYFGFENFGNTCYCNSVLQALYFCSPFREKLHDYHVALPSKSVLPDEENLLLCLGDLFNTITTQRKRTGVIAPRKFVQQLRKENELFRSPMHQDAHEFLNYMLNYIVELIQKESKDLKDRDTKEHSEDGEHENGEANHDDNKGNHKKKKKKGDASASTSSLPKSVSPEGGTFVHDIFEGTLTNETKCLCCESVTSKDESFLDLSIDIDQNTSLTHCLSNFSSIETLSRGDKFNCDKCCSLQEAQKRMKIKKLPKILVVHLKRFKYIEQMQQFKKLSYRVTFPLELILQNTVHDVVDPDRKYNLFAVVIHVGSGPNHGHYISMVKSHGQWLIFDDDNISLVDEGDVSAYFGSAQDVTGTTDCGYLLFYQTETLEAA